jgi:hypothetical protein
MRERGGERERGWVRIVKRSCLDATTFPQKETVQQDGSFQALAEMIQVQDGVEILGKKA